MTLLENIPSVDLGISAFRLEIDQFGPVYRYRVSFTLDAANRMYRGEGSAPSPSQCFDAAMGYLAESVRSAATVND